MFFSAQARPVAAVVIPLSGLSWDNAAHTFV
jgi:hypothetical protein